MKRLALKCCLPVLTYTKSTCKVIKPFNLKFHSWIVTYDQKTAVLHTYWEDGPPTQQYPFLKMNEMLQDTLIYSIPQSTAANKFPARLSILENKWSGTCCLRGAKVHLK